VRFRGDAAEIVLAPGAEELTAAEVPALLERLP
jgi:hypothetical protein